MPTRKEQAAQTRKKIIDVVEAKIREGGYETIRIADIAKACHMSAGNFYHYFSSLEELFDEIDSKKFYESFDFLQKNSQLPVLTRLKSYFTEWLELSLTHYGACYMYYWTRRYTQKAASTQYSNRVTLIADHISQILTDGIQSGELVKDTPVQDISYTIAFLLFGCSAHFGVTNNEELIRQWYTESYPLFIESAVRQYLAK